MSQTQLPRDYLNMSCTVVGMLASGKQILEGDASRWWIILFCLFASGFIATAYVAFFTRKTEPDPTPLPPPAPRSSPPISLHSAKIEDGRGPESKLGYPLKFRAILRNETSETIHVGELDWVAGSKQGQIQVKKGFPFGTQYQVEVLPDGLERNEWQDELHAVTVPPGARFRVWVGLNPEHEKWSLDRMLDAHAIGMIMLPVTVGDKTTELSIKP